MKYLVKLALLLVAVLLFNLTVSPAFSKSEANIAMVLWRGMTEAEKGFQSYLTESGACLCGFEVFDAGQDKAKLAQIVHDLDAEKYDLIYSFGTTVTKTLKKEITDRPIVFNIVSRPIKAKVINSWENSGSNVTGASNAVPMKSAFSTLSRVMKIRRLGFLYNPKEMNSVIQRDEIEKLQGEFGYRMVDTPVSSLEELQSGIRKLLDHNVDAVLLPSDSFVKASADEIIPLLNENKIPSIVSIPAMVRDNKAFLGLGPDYFELGKLAGVKAAAILNGEKPNDIPSSTLKRLHMTVNLSTASKIGVNVPIQVLRLATVIQ